jgi:hypothetical protein
MRGGATGEQAVPACRLTRGELKSSFSPRLAAQRPEKPIILAPVPADKRKNICALVEAYGQSSRATGLANLVIVPAIAMISDELEDSGAQRSFPRASRVAGDRLYGRVTCRKHHQRHQVADLSNHHGDRGRFIQSGLMTVRPDLIEAAAEAPLLPPRIGGPCDISACWQLRLFSSTRWSGSACLLKLLEDRSLAQSVR